MRVNVGDVNVGDRVRMTGLMPDEPNPIAIGEMGTVTGLNMLSSEPHQIFVRWDSGRSLILLSIDPFEVVQ